MSMMRILKRDIDLMGTASIDANEFKQLQAEWTKRCPMEPQKPDAVKSNSTDLLSGLLDVCDGAVLFGCDSDLSDKEQLEWYRKRDAALANARRFLDR